MILKMVRTLFLLTLAIGFSTCGVNKYSEFNKTKKIITLGERKKKAIQLTFRTKLNASAEKVWSDFKKESFWIDMLKPKVIL